MAKIELTYEPTELEEAKSAVKTLASSWSIVGGGIENVTVVSSEGAASIAGDTLYLDFPTVASASNFTLNNQTVKGASITGADINFDSGIANITISGADVLTVNGAEVSAVSITGADVNIESDTAVVSITGGIDSVSVVGGAMFASIDSGTLYLLGADTTPKSGANLSVPATINAELGDIITINANHNGDGVLSFLPAPSATLSATDFTYQPINSQTISAWLSETADYYAAAKNIVVNVSRPTSTIHFDFSQNLNDNKGLFYRKPADTKTVTFAEGGVMTGFTLYSDFVTCGSKSFTFDWWQKMRGGTPFFAYMGDNAHDEVSTTAQYVFTPFQDQGRFLFISYGTTYFDATPALGNFSDWRHFAYTYDHSTGIHRLFIAGKAVYTSVNGKFLQTEGTKAAIAFDNYGGSTTAQCIIKNFNYTPDKCLWTQDFEV